MGIYLVWELAGEARGKGESKEGVNMVKLLYTHV
jgi:hypothetical protein